MIYLKIGEEIALIFKLQFFYVIEICGKLDKSNTKLKFRCVIFHLALFQFHVLEINPNEISHI